ncbi:hypothetical protein BCR41DRAFT_376145 [Lobosporangium transversale]|uniref:Secreted protein n=1 Tax=Lobosporangium transversale TaxID=64571 RepID=A0A1Y2G0J9_9FUNG|nr:hypothetical protein BCR41DRAFT_376145 [Lobosporangium transversale]ORY89195.1 hypothetical protein BCR41DRAFT_376145 [Lobosporangium transversale]|eukprot:XP_021875043.1 hypothetical protein BCR41DRAFT_376145 [Lobosporangium transversale]
MTVWTWLILMCSCLLSETGCHHSCGIWSSRIPDLLYIAVKHRIDNTKRMTKINGRVVCRDLGSRMKALVGSCQAELCSHEHSHSIYSIERREFVINDDIKGGDGSSQFTRVQLAVVR